MPEKLHVNTGERVIQLTVIAMAVVLILGGSGMILYSVLAHRHQDQLSAKLEQAFDQGIDQIEIDPDAFAIPGEGYDAVTLDPILLAEDGLATGESLPAQTIYKTSDQSVNLTAIGKLDIPKIDLKIVLAEGVDIFTLRYAVGHYPKSATIGDPGQSILLGHRMYTYGRFFNRLDELALGDQIIAIDKQKMMTFAVTQVETVLPSELYEPFHRQYETPHLMLVTCTPVRVASHRLLVTCELIASETLDGQPLPTPTAAPAQATGQSPGPASPGGGSTNVDSGKSNQPVTTPAPAPSPSTAPAETSSTTTTVPAETNSTTETSSTPNVTSESTTIDPVPTTSPSDPAPIPTSQPTSPSETTPTPTVPVETTPAPTAPAETTPTPTETVQATSSSN